MSAHSPVNLPERIAEYFTTRYVSLYARELRKGGAAVTAQHFGVGLAARNFMRREVSGWTDQELDDLWHRVMIAAGTR